MNIPFLNFEPSHSAIKAEMQAAFEAVYDGNWFIMGKHLTTFEQEYALFSNNKYAIGVSNGLDALVLSLRALGVGPGDEVIVPSHTFVASVLAVSHVGATPVFVEPDEQTYNLNPSLIAAAITKRTKVIMPVHLYGQACDMEAILRVAKEHNLFVLEDNAQAHGAGFKNKDTGSWGDISGVSFYPGKNLGALGDGGMITTSNAQLADQVKMLRNYGSTIKYKHEIVGYNMRLDEMQAAFLSVKLRYLPQWTLERQQIASWYNEALQGIGDIITPYVHSDSSHVYHLYVIRTQHRDALQAHLKEKGIGTLIHYPIPVHLQEAYQSLGYREGDFPIAEELSKTCLSLPVWVGMEKREIQYIIDNIETFYNKH